MLFRSYGTDDFYRGQIAAAIVSDMRAHGGLITFDDLERCEVFEREPLWGTYRNLRIAAPSPPGGGLAMLLSLKLLESRIATAGTHNGDLHAHRLAECLKLGLATWKLRSGDPRFVQTDPRAFLSETVVRKIGGYISDERALKIGDVAENLVPDSRDTTQVSVIDRKSTRLNSSHEWISRMPSSA